MQMDVCARIRNYTAFEATPGPMKALLAVGVPLPGTAEEVKGVVRNLVTVQINGALDIYEEMIVMPEKHRRIIRTRSILKAFLRGRGLDGRSIRHILRPDSPNPFSDRELAARLSEHMEDEHGIRIHPDNLSDPVMMGRLVKQVSRFLP